MTYKLLNGKKWKFHHVFHLSAFIWISCCSSLFCLPDLDACYSSFWLFFLFISFCVCIRSYLSKFIFLHLERIVIVILFIFSDISDKVFFYPEYPFQTAKLLSSHPPRVLISRLASPSPGQIHWNRGWGAGGSMGKRSSASSPMSPSASLGVDTEALMLSSECSFDVAHVSNLLARIIEVRCQSDSLV